MPASAVANIRGKGILLLKPFSHKLGKLLIDLLSNFIILISNNLLETFSIQYNKLIIHDMQMIYGIGTDIVAIDRIKNLYRTYNLRFINRILSRGEIDILPRNNAHIFIAGRFAAKESLFKAMGSRGSLGFTDIEILNDHAGRPFMRDHSRIRENIQSLKETDSLRIHISISHERAYATALVIIEIE